MISSSEVFLKIKQMSTRTYSSTHRILLGELAAEMALSQDDLLVLLMELQNKGYIQINSTRIASVNLTNFGLTQDKV